MHFMFFCLIVVLVVMFIPVKVFEVKGDSKILTPVVKTGDYVRYETSYCKYKDIESTVSKVLVNGLFFSYSPYQTRSLKLGCHTVEVFSQIPHFIDAGTYHITISSQFKVNPLRTEVINYKTEEFKVIK